MSGTKTGDLCSFAVFLAHTIVSAADLSRLDLDSDLLASRGEVYNFCFHFSIRWCERGDSNPHTFRYQILSLARLPIPPLSLLNLTAEKLYHVSSQSV